MVNPVVLAGLPAVPAMPGADSLGADVAGARRPLGDPRSAPANVRDYLCCRVGDADYGIAIERIAEIRYWDAPTVMAGLPPVAAGVLPWRGRGLLLIDLRRVLQLPEVARDRATGVVVIEAAGHAIGLIVDDVADIVSLHANQRLSAPGYATTLLADTVVGLGAIGDRMLVLFDVDRLLMNHGVVAEH